MNGIRLDRDAQIELARFQLRLFHMDQELRQPPMQRPHVVRVYSTPVKLYWRGPTPGQRLMKAVVYLCCVALLVAILVALRAGPL